jgi:adenylosuccinate lyase
LSDTKAVHFYPRDPSGAVEKWRQDALLAEELRVELKAAQAAAYLETSFPDTVKATDAIRDAYATAQTADLAKRAAAAAVEAKVAERWAHFVTSYIATWGVEWNPEAPNAND